jgi:hypothetical protein
LIKPPDTLREKLKKGGSPIFHQDSKTIVADHQQLRSAIGAEAILFHAQPSDRSSVFLVPASWNQVQPPIFARFDSVTSKPHPTCKRLRRKQPLLLPEMIVRLLCGVVNPKRAEVRSTNHAVGRHSLESPIASPREFVSEFCIRRHSSRTGRWLKLYD